VDVPELAGAPTTSENVAKAIFARLSEAIGARLKRVKLFETARNAFEVEAS
jgi:6-pyruvoyltetrahydropterin/6-carboxytetrahydropterin synthase